MLTQAFTNIIGLSMTASVMIVITLLMKLGLRKRSSLVKQSAFVVLWLLVFIRLILPLNFANPVIFKDTGTPVQRIYHIAYYTNGIDRYEIYKIVSFIWITVAAILLIYTATAYIFTIRKVSSLEDLSISFPAVKADVRRLKFEIGIKRHISIKVAQNTPAAVYGILKPVIILNTNILDDCSMVIVHELVHVKRHDNLKKLLVRFCCCMHWFNPLIWIAAGSMSRDIESACDEGVLRVVGHFNRTNYATSIFRVAEKTKENLKAESENGFSSFGRHPVVGRIHHMLTISRKAKALPTIVMVVILFFCMGCMSSPVHNITEHIRANYIMSEDFIEIQIPYRQTHKIAAYTIRDDIVYFVLENKTDGEALGEKIFVSVDSQGKTQNSGAIASAQAKLGSNIYVSKDALFFFSRTEDDPVCLTKLSLTDDCKKLTGQRYDIYHSNVDTIPLISGNGDKLVWYEGKLLVIFDTTDEKFERKTIVTSGDQDYTAILDGYVGYPTVDDKGQVYVNRYDTNTGEVICVPSILPETYSVYANEKYIVYKEAFKPGADIAVYDIENDRSVSLWEMLPAGQIRKENEWGINLIGTRLILTGKGNNIYAVDLSKRTVSASRSDHYGIGFYNPQAIDDQLFAIQFNDDGEESGNIYWVRLIPEKE